MGYIRNIIRSLKNRLFSNSLRAIEVNSLLLGKINTRQIVNIKKLNSLKEAEFRVFSQWGDDGIIQYLINKIPKKLENYLSHRGNACKKIVEILDEV